MKSIATIDTCDLDEVTGGGLANKLIGSTAGTMFATGVASAFCGPVAPGCVLAFAGAGLLGGAYAGDKVLK